jgi:AraC-like DNA-binding protein
MKPEIFLPSKSLQNYVWCYWNLEGDNSSTPTINTIVPDGTIKLIFHYREGYHHIPWKGHHQPLPQCFLMGQLTKPFVVAPMGGTGTFVVRFRPNGLLPFVHTPLSTYENTPFPLVQVFGKEGFQLEQSILLAKNTSERIAILETFLMSQQLKNFQQDPTIQNAVDIILSSKGQLIFHEVISDFSLQRRQLLRKFKREIGMSPKQLANTIKIQSALKIMLLYPYKSLTELAYELEYYDQSHFIKEFKKFTGITPGRFHGDDLKMSLIFDQWFPHSSSL